MKPHWLRSPKSPIHGNKMRESSDHSNRFMHGARSPRCRSPQLSFTNSPCLNSRSFTSPSSPYSRIMTPEVRNSFLGVQAQRELRTRRPQGISYSESLTPEKSYSFFPKSPSTLYVPSHLRPPFPRETGYVPVNLLLMDCDVWSNLRVAEDKIDRWSERLRKYICQTVFVRLSDEIEMTNSILADRGCSDLQIGQSINFTVLSNLTTSRPDLLPRISTLINFLDVGNQEYVVQRVKDLSSGGCLGTFTWNSGGHYKRKWTANLPADSALLMHFFCCYMDSMLPADGRYVNGKKFTSMYFLRAIDEPDVSTMQDSAYILEVSSNPPRYAVISEGNLIHVKNGGSNVFHTILLFLYLVKVKNDGILERLSLGRAGLNALWVFDD